MQAYYPIDNVVRWNKNKTLLCVWKKDAVVASWFDLLLFKQRLLRSNPGSRFLISMSEITIGKTSNIFFSRVSEVNNLYRAQVETTVLVLNLGEVICPAMRHLKILLMTDDGGFVLANTGK